jgi:hypothetical protein
MYDGYGFETRLKPVKLVPALVRFGVVMVPLLIAPPVKLSVEELGTA